MTEPFYTSRVTVRKVHGVHRRATLPGGVEFDMGVHGPVREHYRIDAPDLPLPVDYVVASAAGWMLGTLNGALEVRGVRLEPDAIQAEAEGINEIVDRLPVLTRIHIRYRLTIPPGAREKVDRALAGHQSKCPTAASLRGAVEIGWEAEIEEEEP